MDTVTYPDSEVESLIVRHCVPVRIHVKGDPTLASRYAVAWTPNVVLEDEAGRVHHRIVGFLPPEEFMAELSLGLGRVAVFRKDFEAAVDRFEKVLARHPEGERAAEATYWLGVAEYKASRDPARLKARWATLAREHPASPWARRTEV